MIVLALCLVLFWLPVAVVACALAVLAWRALDRVAERRKWPWWL